MDGVDSVTQTGIPGFFISGGDANSTAVLNATAAADRNASVASPVFVYNFVTNAAGAFWYHDHSQQLTYVDGFCGALVVSDPWSPVEHVSRNYTNVPAVLLADHYHQKTAYLAAQFVNTSNSEGVEPVPKSLTINGYAGVREFLFFLGFFLRDKEREKRKKERARRSKNKQRGMALSHLSLALSSSSFSHHNCLTSQAPPGAAVVKASRPASPP